MSNSATSHINALTAPISIEGLEANKSHYAAIGRVAAEWAFFERIIDAWSLDYAAVTEQIGVCFTAQIMGSRAKLDAFISLAGLFGASKSRLAGLRRFAQNIVGLAEQRNRAIHDMWELTDPKKPQRHEATARKVVRLLKIHVPTNELLDLADTIKKTRLKFNMMAAEIWYETMRASLDRAQS